MNNVVAVSHLVSLLPPMSSHVSFIGCSCKNFPIWFHWSKMNMQRWGAHQRLFPIMMSQQLLWRSLGLDLIGRTRWFRVSCRYFASSSHQKTSIFTSTACWWEHPALCLSKFQKEADRHYLRSWCSAANFCVFCSRDEIRAKTLNLCFYQPVLHWFSSFWFLLIGEDIHEAGLSSFCVCSVWSGFHQVWLSDQNFDNLLHLSSFQSQLRNGPQCLKLFYGYLSNDFCFLCKFQYELKVGIY